MRKEALLSEAAKTLSVSGRGRLTFISTIWSHLLNSGEKSMAPATATPLAPIKPYLRYVFSEMSSRNGRPMKLTAKVETCCEVDKRKMAELSKFGENLASRSTVSSRLHSSEGQ